MADEALETGTNEAVEANNTEAAEAAEVEMTAAEAHWATLTPREREQIYALASEGERALKREREPKPEPKPEPVKVPETTDPAIKAMLSKLEKLEAAAAAQAAKEKAKEEAAQAAAELARFNADLDEVLAADDLFSDKSARIKQGLKDKFAGLWMRERPANRKAAFRAMLEEESGAIDEVVSAKHTNYIKGKLRAKKQTAGETGGGSVPATEKYEPTAEDMRSGALLKRLKAERGIS